MTEEKLREDSSKALKTPKNWNDLPPEIKLKAIEFLNFKERIRLGQTSHTEKRLVDALRYDFDDVKLIGNSLTLRRLKTRERYSIPTQNHEISKILKNLKMERFNSYENIQMIPNKPGLIQTKYFRSIRDFDSAKEIVKNLWDKTERITLDLNDKPISIDELMNIPQIRKVPDLELNYVNKEQVVPLIQKWIKIDKESGSKLTTFCWSNCCRELAAKFEFQKIPQDSSKVRIENGKFVLHFKKHPRCEIYCTEISTSY